MKLLHIADLHIGKRVNEFSMIEDQRHILSQILTIVRDEKAEAVLIAGDVYDKSQPSIEAVELLDEFLTSLTEMGPAIYIISGNHDSPERLGFGSRILGKNRLFIAGAFTGSLQETLLEDAYGNVHVFLLPFIKPAVVSHYLDQSVETYDEAARMVLDTAKIDTSERNILLAHQFVTNGLEMPEHSDSENLSVGGLDNVDASAFILFDYVALGHLHRPQTLANGLLRYAGSPLKYSFSEARGKKSVTIVELKEKGTREIRTVDLFPLHDVREIKGPLAHLLQMGTEDVSGNQDYIHAILTDEEELYDAIGQMRRIYPNLMALDFDNSKTSQTNGTTAICSDDIERKQPIELFSDFYLQQNNEELSAEGLAVLKDVFAQAGGKEL
ncbi:exonuclease SbcD [Sphaerochaeta pleomorpha str. Grapes]|uniref:Nuclease SbcCD subunit D n=1 Tax=Sphaerochaeta pleomorpha (strain ATCC BAA-1885 / DSM 22778 / Grapes) TaxID=158190 RepID=G8QRP2_SPHPG|nr:exonuclease SbcCD subunit D [Sphaerochaeta pleomorpha]AEV28825.1 exonuclease SbcD [Sphaerochaeta pleomorpha str. Grapes]